MQRHIQAGLSKEQIKQIYDKEFNDEFNAVKTNIHSVTRGNAAFANVWKDWIGVAAISIGVIAIGGMFGLLSAFGIVPAFVSVVVNSVVAMTGVVAGVAYQKFGIKKKQQAYQDAELFLENEFTPENLDKLRNKLFAEIYPALENSTAAQINVTMKSVMAVIANLIINKQVTRFDQLISKDFCLLLSLSMKAAPKFAMNTKLLQSMLRNIPDVRSRADVADRVGTDRRTRQNSVVNVSAVNSTLWLPSKSSSAPQLSFTRDENVKSLHLR